MTLTDPLIRHNTLDREFPAGTSETSDRDYVQLALAGCFVFWLCVGAIIYFSL